MPHFPLKIRLIAVGKLRESHWVAAANDYAQRLQHYLDLEIIEIKDRVGKGKADAEAVAAEGNDIRQALRPEARAIVLNIEGKPLSSTEFADWLQHCFAGGQRALDFVLGGPLGLSAELIKRADVRLSLSTMTLPHELARIVLLEQLYRGCTILRGEKYHK